MPSEASGDAELFSQLSDVDIMQMLLANLHDDLVGKVGRFRRLSDLSAILGFEGTMIPGGQTAYSAWVEARASYVHGNFVATVMLVQGLAEHVLASYLHMGWPGENLPTRSHEPRVRHCFAEIFPNDR